MDLSHFALVLVIVVLLVDKAVEARARRKDREEMGQTLLDLVSGIATSKGAPLRADQGPVYGEIPMPDGSTVTDDGRVSDGPGRPFRRMGIPDNGESLAPGD